MDAFVMVDWSAASTRGPAEGRADGLWAAVAAPGEDDRVLPFRTRVEAREWLVEELLRLVDLGHRVLCGLDFSFGYPAGTANALGMPSGTSAWRWMWERIAREVRDDEDGRNDRFEAAARMNQAMGRRDGPFWGNGTKGDITGLPRTKGTYPMEVVNRIRLEEFRTVERTLRAAGSTPLSAWQLSGAGAVGGQVLVGLPTLWRLRHHHALRDITRVWPFEVPTPLGEPGVTLAEVYPSLLPDDPALHDVRDARQVLALVDGYRQMAADGALAGAFELPPLESAAREAVLKEEGWILPVTRDASRPRTPVRRSGPAPFIPRGLIESITTGHCVAFVGAGFSAPEVPSWAQLVADLAEDPGVPDGLRRQVAALTATDRPTQQALEAAAQLIADGMPDGGLRPLLQARLEEGPQSTRRRDHLAGIPFAAILTTNLDPGLTGMLPGPAAYAALLRADPSPWWHDRHWQLRSDAEGSSFAPQLPPVLKLHGDVGIDGGDQHLVFTAKDRRRLWAEGGAATFLRSLMASRTILYLGKSLDDADLTRIRSEVLALVGYDHRSDAPLAYAVLPDVSAEQQAHHRTHDGIEVLGYDTAGDDHSGFDDILAAIHDQAGHDAQLHRAMEGRTILWVDPVQSRNAPGITRLREVVGEALILVGGVSEARGVLRSRPVDLVITHWGHREGGRPVGEEVLAAVRASRNPCPTLVFAWGDYADVNRPRALALGATDYVWSWPALFREVTRVLAPAPRNPLDLSSQLDAG